MSWSSAWAGWSRRSGALAVGVVLIGVQRVRQTNRQLAHSNALLTPPGRDRPAHRPGQPAPPAGGDAPAAAADGSFAGTVFLADLDHFKRVNDRHGHAAGDAVLVEVAQRLRSMLRDADLIVRWGGEEFLVIVRALDADAVQALAQRMLDVIGGTPCTHEGKPIAITVSIGYATFPIEPGLLSVSWERAIGLVDTAMYLAKAHGRNRAYGVRMLRAQDESAARGHRPRAGDGLAGRRGDADAAERPEQRQGSGWTRVGRGGMNAPGRCETSMPRRAARSLLK